MEYKKTAEYVYDLMMYFYNIHKENILKLGKERFIIYIPNELYELLACRQPYTGTIVYPTKFKEIEIKDYAGSTILFALKEKG